MVRATETNIVGDEIVPGEARPAAGQLADPAYFEQIVHQHKSYAYALAFRFLCDEAEAADVVQDAFLRVWSHRNRYDPEKKFTTWLYTIVTNLCLDRSRSRKRRGVLFLSKDREPELSEFPDTYDWEKQYSNEELAGLIRMMVEHLSKKQRLVFTLRDLQNLTIEEVVDITGMSVGSVKMNLHHARKALRDLLAQRYGVVRSDL